jgi:ABC-type sugar transport system permease subunit
MEPRRQKRWNHEGGREEMEPRKTRNTRKKGRRNSKGRGATQEDSLCLLFVLPSFFVFFVFFVVPSLLPSWFSLFRLRGSVSSAFVVNLSSGFVVDAVS